MSDYSQKFNINMPTLKINISERKLLIFLKFLNSIQTNKDESKVTAKKPSWPTDRILIRWNPKYLLHVQNYITLQTFVLSRRKNDKANASSTQKR